MDYKKMYELEKSSHLSTDLELQKFKKMHSIMLDRFSGFDEYDKAIYTLIKVHVDHLNSRYIFDLTENETKNLSMKLTEDEKFCSEMNHFFQTSIEKNRNRFNI